MTSLMAWRTVFIFFDEMATRLAMLQTWFLVIKGVGEEVRPLMCLVITLVTFELWSIRAGFLVSHEVFGTHKDTTGLTFSDSVGV